MKKIVFLTFFVLISLSARENPFSPQNMVQEPKLILPKLIIKKPVEIKIVEKEEPKKVPMKIPEIVIEKTVPTVITKPIIIKAKKAKKVKKRKVRKPISKSKLIYNGKFTKIRLISNTIKIVTKDTMLQHSKLTHPNRLVLDFERFDVVPPFSKKIYSKKIKGLRVGHHDYFYRTTFKMLKNYRYKTVKKPYGYLIKL